MNICNYVQSLFGTYLAATDTLKYDIINYGESLTMITGGIMLLSFSPQDGKSR